MLEEFNIAVWHGNPADWIYGNMRKWCDNGIWYKEDFPDRPEGAAEYLVTQILRASNASSFAEYEMISAKRNEEVIHLCKSKDFLTNGKAVEGMSKSEKAMLPQLKTAYDILRDHYTEFDTGRNPVGWWGMYNRMTKGMSNKQLVQNFVNVIEEETGLTDFGGYLTQLFELDALTRNIDRHLRNICVVFLPEEYRYGYCPIFDNGASFSATTHYDFNTMKDLDAVLFSKLKPTGLFGSSFEKTVDICHELYGPRLQVLKSLNLDPHFVRVAEMYDEATANKMKRVWLRARGLHQDLFVDRLSQQPINEFYLYR